MSSSAERKRRLRQQRRESRLCVRCGKQDDRTKNGMQHCAECAEKARHQNQRYRASHPSFREQQRAERAATYAWMRQRQVCVRCQTQDAFTLAGKCLCADCAEKESQRSRDKAARTARKTAKDNERKAAGLCVQCGKTLDRDGIYCRRCVFIKNRNQRRKRIEDGINWPRGDNGYCYQCNKELRLPGRGVCQKCYDQQLGRLSHVYNGQGPAAPRPDDHPFRQAARAAHEKRKYRNGGQS